METSFFDKNARQVFRRKFVAGTKIVEMVSYKSFAKV